MDAAILTAFLGVAGMIGCFYWALKPLWQGARHDWRASTIWSDWLDRKRTLLFNMEDLAHEQKLGKLSQDDFNRLQAAYKKELMGVLDQMEHTPPPDDFQQFMLSGFNAGGLPGQDPHHQTKACFPCKEFFDASFAYCPKCGKALTVPS